jgi:hypothetical protein
MYYIVNETNQMIAADESLLNLCGFTHINELNTQIILEKITFNIADTHTLTIHSDQKVYHFSTTPVPLSTLLGKLTLIHIEEEIETSVSSVQDDEINIESLIIKQNVQEEDSIIIQDIEKEIFQQPTIKEVPLVENDDIPMFHIDSLNADTSKETIKAEAPKEHQSEEIQTDTPTLLEEKEDIFIDVPHISQEIGVSEEDFHAFLNEYISTALDLEKDLQSQEKAIRTNAINTLAHLSDVLHLDTIGDIIQKIETSSDEDRISHITTFYDALSRITTLKTVHNPILENKASLTAQSENPSLDTTLSSIPTNETKEEEKENLVAFNLEPTPKITKSTPESKDDIVNEDTFELNLDVTPEIIENTTDPKKDTPKEDLFELDLDETPEIIENTTDPKKDTPKEDLFELDLDETPEIIKTKIKNDIRKKDESINLDLDIAPLQVETKEQESQKEQIQLNIPTEPKIETTEEKIVIPETKKVDTFGEIDLSSVAPIHFDFSLHTAADELSLPESLIEEFMIDFVDQAHTETDKMLEAYKKGDLESIQKIGHLLKGVSSNLRVTPLADTLYKIQFCENPDDLESLIKDYWGHFLAFEKQIKLLSN